MTPGATWELALNSVMLLPLVLNSCLHSQVLQHRGMTAWAALLLTCATQRQGRQRSLDSTSSTQ